MNVIPCPPATARTGWTVYDRGAVLGWVRRAESCDPCYHRPAGTFWVIPRGGLGNPNYYATVRDAAASLTQTREAQ